MIIAISECSLQIAKKASSLPSLHLLRKLFSFLFFPLISDSLLFFALLANPLRKCLKINFQVQSRHSDTPMLTLLKKLFCSFNRIAVLFDFHDQFAWYCTSKHPSNGLLSFSRFLGHLSYQRLFTCIGPGHQFAGRAGPQHSDTKARISSLSNAGQGSWNQNQILQSTAGPQFRDRSESPGEPNRREYSGNSLQ